MNRKTDLSFSDPFTVLPKPAGRDFLILNLSDPQLGEEDWEGEAGEILIRTVKELVERTGPDLITVSGDVAYAEQFASYRRFAALMQDFGVPWAPVFGNHDAQGGDDLLRQAAAVLREQSKNCLLRDGDPALGCGNYAVGIRQEGRLIHGLILMDSHDRRDYTDGQGHTGLAWADLQPEQFPWYRRQVEALKAAGAGESTLICHIPLYTYRQAAKAAILPDGGFAPGFEGAFGEMREEICSYPADNGFFDLIKELDHTKTVLCGHDHVNCFSIPWQGVRLIFALKTGPGCYWNADLNGGTLMRIDGAGRLTAEHVYVKV